MRFLFSSFSFCVKLFEEVQSISAAEVDTEFVLFAQLVRSFRP